MRDLTFNEIALVGGSGDDDGGARDTAAIVGAVIEGALEGAAKGAIAGAAVGTLVEPGAGTVGFALAGAALLGVVGGISSGFEAASETD